MNPFKTKVQIDYYESMGYELKTGDTLYSKNREGNYVVYGKLIKFDAPTKCWLAAGGNMKSFPITKVNHYIEIIVIPFDQYLKKMGEKGFTGRK